MLIFFLSLACGPEKVQTPGRMLKKLRFLKKLQNQKFQAPPHQHSQTMSISIHDVRRWFCKSGHVIRLERSENFEGTEDRVWFDDEKLRVELSTSAGDWQQTYWKDIEINVTASRFNPNCVYSSDWIPWLYSCSVGTKSGQDQDGKIWSMNTSINLKCILKRRPENPEVIAFWLKHIEPFNKMKRKFL